MSWFETLTKETFQSLVRDAVRDDIKSLKNELMQEIDFIKQRLTKLEDKVDRIQETQVHFAERVGHLEGALEGTLRSLISDFKYELYERLRGELSEKATS